MHLSGSDPVPCRIVNISRGGAAITFEQADMPPIRFGLQIVATNSLLEVEVAWWRQGQIGVRFLDAR
jgi:hypothetical protein